MIDPVSWFEAIVLGLVQGLTEFIPISSTAHVLIVSQLFGWGDPGAAFTAVTQIGTELAVIVYFRNDIARILVTWFRSLRDTRLRSELDARMGWYIIVGTIPISILGVTFSSQIETAARNLWLVASMLIIFGVVLAFADALGSRRHDLTELNKRDGLLFGLGQALALIPGVSRSGATISTGLALGYTRESAARYSFLLAIPAVLASGFYEMTKIGGDETAAWGPTLLAAVIAFFVGIAVISWLLRWVITKTFLPFVIYRILLGFGVILLLWVGVLTA
ncbi:MAG: undecaprenyl-diphosphate phosphatase [Actinomycetota bacterium]|nr:undecaprenyl-diphosphate phosphatase [Actinomycetota bacterium]MDP2288724.1 undecaprenyl-diphosphate phosphatase [Actinomycetota bacterium]